MKSGKMNKKGFLQETIYGIVVILVIAIVAVIGFNLHNQWNDTVQSDDAFPTESKDSSQNLNNRFPGIFDFMVISMFVAITLGTAVSVYLLEMNPALFGIVAVLFLVVLSLPLYFSNIWEEFITEPTNVGLRSSFPFTDYLLSNYGFVYVGVLTLISLAAFFRVRG